MHACILGLLGKWFFAEQLGAEPSPLRHLFGAPIAAVLNTVQGMLYLAGTPYNERERNARLQGVSAMAYNSKAKIKVLYLLKIFQEETDAGHGLSMARIIERLAEYGVPAERKSIYDDIKALREFGVDVQTYQRNPVEYALGRRGFELDELMLMVDAIQSCRSITDRQAKSLVANVKQLASSHERELLDRRIHVEGRIKSKSESVLGTVDLIHAALRSRCKMEFAYRKLGADGRPYETYQGKSHLVTPVGVSYEDGFYYLTAWDEGHGNMAEYRLDRMVRVRALEGEPAVRNDEIGRYRRGGAKAVMFGRFGGEEVMVTLVAEPGKAEIIADRFGDAAVFLDPDGLMTRARVKVCKSDQFFGWVASMGKAVRIQAPKSLAAEYKAYLRGLLED